MVRSLVSTVVMLWLKAQPTPDLEQAEELISATGAELHFGGDQAFYRRPTPLDAWPNHSAGDFISAPPKSSFNPKGSYYETLFHELAHWSEIRLGWTGTYEAGELIAEMTACYLATELGVPQGESLQNHTAYLKAWLRNYEGRQQLHIQIGHSVQQSHETSCWLFASKPKKRPATGRCSADGRDSHINCTMAKCGTPKNSAAILRFRASWPHSSW